MMRQRRVTVRDVAIRAGVSTATVSRTINGSPHLTKETKARVEKAIQDLGYIVDAPPQPFRTQRTHTLAVVVPTLANPFFCELITAVQAQAGPRGYSVLVLDDSQGEDREEALLRVLFARMVDGVLLINGSGLTDTMREALSEQDHVVAMDRRPGVRACHLVTLDNHQAMGEVVRHLAVLGHRRLAHVGGPMGMTSADDRALAAAVWAHQLGLDADPGLVMRGDLSADWGYEATHMLLDRGAQFTAVSAGCDIVALGVISALVSRGLRVPEDVSVVGVDGIHLSGFANPPLTTYVQPVDHMGQVAADLLIDHIEKGGRRSPDVDTVTLVGDLALRGSTAPIHP